MKGFKDKSIASKAGARSGHHRKMEAYGKLIAAKKAAIASGDDKLAEKLKAKIRARLEKESY